jgi:hypothetical protein
LIFEAVSTLINFRVSHIEGVVFAIGRSQVAIDPAIGEVFLVFAQKGAFINQFTTEPASMTFTLPGFSNGFLDDLGLVGA